MPQGRVEFPVKLFLTLTVNQVIDYACQNLGLPNGRYQLREENGPPMNPDTSLGWNRVSNNDVLILQPDTIPDLFQRVLAQINNGERIPIREEIRVYLQEDRYNNIFDIAWQPAIIGRHSHKRHDPLLAVPLEDLPGGRGVSRRHACVFEQEGHYYIAILKEKINETFINKRPMEMGRCYHIQPGDKIRIGRIHLTFHLRG